MKPPKRRRVKPSKRDAEPSPQSSRMNLSRIAIGIILAAIVITVGGYWIGSDRSPKFDLSTRNGSEAITNKARSKSDSIEKRATQSNELLSASALAAEREQLDKTAWKKERTAQEYEAFFVRLWDASIAARKGAAEDRHDVFKQVPFQEIVVGSTSLTNTLDLEIRTSVATKPHRKLDRNSWQTLLHRFEQEGYRLVQSEWHHAAFDIDVKGKATSTVAMSLHIENTQQNTRVIVEGPLHIEWSANRDVQGIPIPERIDASSLRFFSRSFVSGFREIESFSHAEPSSVKRIHPLIVYDLNGDGRSEVIAAGCNRVYWNRGDFEFESRPFLPDGNVGRSIGLLADLDGDHRIDFMTPGNNGDLWLYSGNADGSFASTPRGKQAQPGPLVRPQVITAGDVDLDGDLDLWVAQYKPAYTRGQMPTPYYDANDGLPSFLLINDGQGNFQDATDAAGLGRKRFRRTYASSFVDLDGDDDLDLLVVSDFAGIDIYLNNGRGHFSDQTESLVDERHNFGMSATFGDFNRDGNCDFFVTGMASTTARRLQRMNLGRSDQIDVQRFRPIMGYGNRMYLANGPRFTEPKFRDQVARTGWSWGTVAVDFNNDGYPDLFTANGHSSGQSTKDHCWHFWCHDIYTNSSELNKDREQLFRTVLKGYLDRTESWDGYQKNALLMNVNGNEFVNVAFLVGVADEFDSRAVAADDLDGDGRVDLMVVEDRARAGQTLHVYRNELNLDRHWINVRFRQGSPIGARVTVSTPTGTFVNHMVVGNSISSQQPQGLHFGLGNQSTVNSIQIRWPDGTATRINDPRVDSYIPIETKID